MSVPVITSGLDTSKVTTTMKKLLYVSVSGVFLDGYDISIISIALIQLKGQFHANPSQLGLLAAAILVGNFIGAIVFGRLADRIGRKTAFLADIVFFVVFAILSGFAQNLTQLIICRFLLGIGIGADYALASPFIAESVPAGRRGRLLTINWGAAWLSGEVAAFAVSLVLLPLGHTAWRWMLASGAIPAIIVLLLRRTVPESPRWLRSRGRDEEALAVEVYLTQSEVVPPPKRQAESALHGSVMTELFKKYRKGTWFGILNYVFEGAPFYALSVFLPSILAGIGFGKSVTGVAEGNLFLQLTGFIGIILCYLWVDSKGRKFVNYLGFGGVALAILLFEIFYPVGVIGTLVIFVLVEAAVWLGPASTDNLFLGELWPTHIRGTGAGIAAAAGRLSAIAGTFLFPIFVSRYGVTGAMYLPLIFTVLGIVNTLLLGIETKGKTLEEMWGD